MAVGIASETVQSSISRRGFSSPALCYHSRPLWFWNGPLDKAKTVEQVRRGKTESGYAGYGILPSHGMTPAFMTAEFLEQYKAAVEAAVVISVTAADQE